MCQVIKSLNAKKQTNKETNKKKPFEADTIIALPSLLQTGETEV